MTKSTGVGRGGKRAGAGRKPLKGALAVSPMPKVSARSPAPASAVELRGKALATLEHIMEHSAQDSARVSAAREVLIRAEAEDSAVGKKALAKSAATARVGSGGKFASAPPPASARTVQ